MKIHAHQVKNCSERLADIYTAKRAIERLGRGFGGTNVSAIEWLQTDERDLWRVLARPIWC